MSFTFTLLSNMQEVLAVARCLLKSYKRKKFYELYIIFMYHNIPLVALKVINVNKRIEKHFNSFDLTKYIDYNRMYNNIPFVTLKVTVTRINIRIP